MNKLELCQKLASLIVKRYRDECPDGFDPQNTYVAAAAAIVGAGASIYSSYQQSKAANKTAQAFGDPSGMLKDALSASDEALYGKRFIPEEYKNLVGTEGSYARDINAEAAANLGMKDGGLPGLFDLTRKINAKNLKNVNANTGGRYSQVVNKSGTDIREMLKGKVPADVVDSINRLVAEHLGGAVNPSAISGGFDFSATAADTARRLGITSFDIMQKGLSFAPAWEQTVQSFLYKPQDAAKDFLFPQISADLSASALQQHLDESQYYSRNNLLRAQAAPDPAARGKLNDALTLIALQSGAQGTAAAATQGLINSGASLAGQVASLGKQVSGYGTTQPAYTGTYEGTAGAVLGTGPGIDPYKPVYRPGS